MNVPSSDQLAVARDTVATRSRSRVRTPIRNVVNFFFPRLWGEGDSKRGERDELVKMRQ